jgi:hypothetical protein
MAREKIMEGRDEMTYGRAVMRQRGEEGGYE